LRGRCGYLYYLRKAGALFESDEQQIEFLLDKKDLAECLTWVRAKMERQQKALAARLAKGEKKKGVKPSPHSAQKK